MKVLIVLTYYLPHWTGLSQYAGRLAEGLADRGYEVEVLCSQHDRALPIKEKINKIMVFRCPYFFRFIRSVIMPRFFLELIYRIKYAEKVIVFLPLQEIFYTILVAKLFRKKIWLIHNGDLVLPKMGGFFYRLVETIYYWTTLFSCKLSDCVIIQTKDYALNSKLLMRCRPKWHVILPPFAIPSIAPRRVAEFKQRYRLAGKKLIGYSGRLVEEKGIDYLLNAIPYIVRSIPNAQIVIAGEYRIKYEKYWQTISPMIEKHRSHITLLGLLNGRQIYTFYHTLDVYVQPSRTDCFPFSQVEAMLSGIPSVCTDIPGARWVVKQSGMGIVVRPHSSSSLATGIVEVVKNRNRYRQRYTSLKNLFSYQSSINAYEKLLQAN